MDITTTKRRLTRAEAILLHQELRSTPNILGYTVRELERLTDVQVAEVGDRLAGACWSVDLSLGWTEIAALYVLPDFRGRGIGQALFRAAWDSAQGRGRHVYVLSRNPQVVRWMRELGMTVDGKLCRAPLAVQWYMQWYMLSWHRVSEAVRKRREIRSGPRLVQGMLRFDKAADHAGRLDLGLGQAGGIQPSPRQENRRPALNEQATDGVSCGCTRDP